MHEADGPPGQGHNDPKSGAVQWQTPHLKEPLEAGDDSPGEPDLDLVEDAFDEGFKTASDPVSFLRLAGVPLAIVLDDGRKAHLLRVEREERVDVGAVSPKLGGGHTVRPLPAKLVGRRRQLRLIYQADDDRPVILDFTAARAAEATTPD